MNADFKPMLAGRAPDNLDLLQYPLVASPKLDGIRAHIIDGIVYSRNLKPFPNEALQRRFGVAALNGLDGELIWGDPTASDAFRNTGSNVMAHDGDVTKMTFHVFDDFTHPYMGFKDRLSSAQVRVKSVGGFWIVGHEVIRTAAQLVEYEAQMVAQGYEGVMLRATDHVYKFGRSTTREGSLLKLKRFRDGEAEIIGLEEFQHNLNERDAKGKRSGHKAGKVAGGKLGALLVRDTKTGVEFNVGSGFTDSERVNFWGSKAGWIGQIIKYKYFPTGSKEKPRFPTYEGLRHPIDM